MSSESGRRMLVVAPHPDDEVLGCAGLLANAAAAGVDVRVLYATDGGASHVGSIAYPRERLRDVREAEARTGLAELGLSPTAAHFMREPDGALACDSKSRTRFVSAVRSAIAAFEPTAVYSPWIRDVHPDHVATSRAVRVALAALDSQATLYEYRVWGEPLAIVAEPGVRAVERIDISASLRAKRAALAAHRSQLGGLIVDAERSFTLPSELVARAMEPYETFYEIARSAWT